MIAWNYVQVFKVVNWATQISKEVKINEVHEIRIKRCRLENSSITSGISLVTFLSLLSEPYFDLASKATGYVVACKLFEYHFVIVVALFV